MPTKLTIPEYNAEEWDAYYNRRTERLRAFEEAVRAVAYEHGFWLTYAQTDDNRTEATTEVEYTFRMDNGKPPKERGVSP